MHNFKRIGGEVVIQTAITGVYLKKMVLRVLISLGTLMTVSTAVLTSVYTATEQFVTSRKVKVTFCNLG